MRFFRINGFYYNIDRLESLSSSIDDLDSGHQVNLWVNGDSHITLGFRLREEATMFAAYLKYNLHKQLHETDDGTLLEGSKVVATSLQQVLGETEA